VTADKHYASDPNKAGRSDAGLRKLRKDGQGWISMIDIISLGAGAIRRSAQRTTLTWLTGQTGQPKLILRCFGVPKSELRSQARKMLSLENSLLSKPNPPRRADPRIFHADVLKTIARQLALRGGPARTLKMRPALASIPLAFTAGFPASRYTESPNTTFSREIGFAGGLSDHSQG
jgi:hypothetical protein